MAAFLSLTMFQCLADHGKKFFCMRKQLFEWVHKNTIELQSLKNENF